MNTEERGARLLLRDTVISVLTDAGTSGMPPLTPLSIPPKLLPLGQPPSAKLAA